MAALDRLAERELGAMEALFVMGDSEVHTRSTIVMLARLDSTLPFEIVQQAHDQASRLVPHLRRRVIAPVVPISRPYWAVDPDFDLSYHVRRVRVPGEGTEQDLMTLVESLGAAPLDVARPLWDVTLVEGLADGTSALVYKFHHAISDGQGIKEIFSSLFQLEPGSPPATLPPLPAAEDLTRLDVTRQRLNQLPLELAYAGVSGARGLLQRGAGVLRRPRSSATATRDYLQSLRRTVAPTAESSPLLQRRGLRRRYAILKVPQADLHRAARALHVSLNSAYVAGVVGGIARYHEAHGAAVPELAVAMPVSIRRPGDKAEENRFVAARVAAPASGATVQERATAINDRVRRARDEPALEAMTAVAPMMSRLPLWLTVALAGGLAMTTDCQISNIAGYPYPVYLGNARVVGFHGFGPLAGAAMMVVMTSANGSCDIAFHVDADAVTDVDQLVRCVHESFAELLALGGAA